MPDLFDTDEIVILSTRAPILVTLVNGMELYSQFFKATDFKRMDDMCQARFTHALLVDHWADVEPNGLLHFPWDNVSGYEFKKPRDPIVINDPVDLDALRAMIPNLEEPS